MNVSALAERIEGALRTNRVFGEPVTLDGVTVIPVARIGMGGGGGMGRDTGLAGAAAEQPDAVEQPDDAEKSDSPLEAPARGRAARRSAGEGAGGGLGWSGKPCGVFVLHDGEVHWKPAVDVNRIVTAAAVMTITLLLAVRSVAKARTRA
jgi:uncharacterized spore protein YtfJ